ncbi:MAG: hypothetical protein AB8H86_27745, partial [Polyangiales bacterium]
MKLCRRDLLIGGAAALGGSALAATPLSPFRRVARAAPGSAKRFIFVMSGNGYDASVTMSPAVRSHIEGGLGESFDDTRWFGTGYADRFYSNEDSSEVRSLDGALAGAPGLRRFEELGLLDRCAMVYGLSSMVTGGGHSASHGVLSSTRTLAGTAGGESIDHYLARLETVRGMDERRAPLSAIRVGSTSGNRGIGYGLCAADVGVGSPVLYSPEATWNAYIKPFVDDDGLEALDYRQRLLEVSERDAQRVLEELGAANMQAANMLTAAENQLADLDLLRRRVMDRFGRLSAPPESPGPLADPFEYARFQMGVVASAFEAELSRVAVVSLGAGGGRWGWSYGLGPATTGVLHDEDSIHSFSGEGNAGGSTHTRQSVRDELREVWARELDAVADMAAQLDSIPEVDGDGSMLDHTIITYVADNGCGHHATARDYPTLVVGGSALGLRTGGRALFYPEYKGGTEGRREL